MRELACGVATLGQLELYVSPFDWPPDEEPRTLARLPPDLARRARTELRRRVLCDEVAGASVAHAGTTLELAGVLARRAGWGSGTRRLLRLRNLQFDRAVVTRLSATTGAVVAATSASLGTLRHARARGIMSFLNYPIAHHAFSAAILTEEAQLRPEYAGTLQSHTFPRSVRSQLEAEIATADRVLVLSTFQKRTFVQCGVPEEKLLVTPLGVDTSLFRPKAATRPTNDVFRVMFSGQIGQRKGIAYLVDAFRLADIPGSELVLVGAPVGSEAPWSRLPNVRHVPHVPRWKLPELYAQADVFVFPSLVEGFGLTPLEAMACGVPVIVSTHTFADDVIENGKDGYIVPVRNAEAIAKLLVHFAEDEDARQAIGCGARRKAERFTWGRYRREAARAIGRAADLLP